MKTLVAFAAAIGLSALADAADLAALNGATLIKLEREGRSDAVEMYSWGVFEAALAAKLWFASTEQYNRLPPLLVCPPLEATSPQVGAVVLRYVHEHPEDWHQSAFQLVQAALTSAWPCKSIRK